MTKLFPLELTSMVPRYSRSTRAFAEKATAMLNDPDAVVSHVTVQRAMNGEGLPGVEMLGMMMGPLTPEDRARLVKAYLLDHIPSNVHGVTVQSVLDDDTQDRLSKACGQLPSYAREWLATYVESINAAPSTGHLALEGLAGMLQPEAAFTTRGSDLALVAEEPAPYNKAKA